jgi:PAS domain S-box-containing protein
VLTSGNVKSILGFPTEYWDARSIFDQLHPDDLERVQALFVEIMATPGLEMQGEARVRNADGSWIDAEVSAVNMLDDPSVAGIVLTTRNITARKQYEADLAEARDQAVRALATRTEFIASVSHELRTPIHGVLGLAELLEAADLDDEARHLARSITRATESLRMVLDDILDFSKIEVGRLEINPGPLRIVEVGQDLQALFGAQATAKGISLIIEKGDDLPEWVEVDGLRLRQVLNNLVSNAIKFTFAGEVRARAERVPTATLGDEVVDRVRVSVRDTGVGIALDQHDLLVEPFSQAHTSTRQYGGTGLGLSIARRLVELMGGELHFRSAPGHGTEFWFDLPLVALDPDEAKRRIGADEPLESIGDRRTRVLVVEDNPINQLLVRRQLERLGHDVVIYDAGLPAIEAFPDAACDVVLMDWQLPGIDGLETARRLRAWEAEHNRLPTPIVAMTASALPGDRARCLEAGMDDFVAKPVSMATLGAVVDRWSRSRAHAASWGALAGPDPVPGGDESTFDPRALEQLYEELADARLVVTVARTYLRELPGRVTAIADALGSGDRAALAAAAHTLKSTSAALGAVALADLCLRLEQRARVAPTTPPPVSIDQIRSAAAAAEVAVAQAAKQLEARPA